MDTCPRRILIDDRTISHALELYNHTSGTLGPSLVELPSHLVEALDRIADGVHRRRQEERELEDAKARLAHGR